MIVAEELDVVRLRIPSPVEKIHTSRPRTVSGARSMRTFACSPMRPLALFFSFDMLFLSTCLEIITIVYGLFKLEDSAIASSAREQVLRFDFAVLLAPAQESFCRSAMIRLREADDT